MILIDVHHQVIASSCIMTCALRPLLCRMYVILCISVTLMVLAACDCLYVRLVYALVRRRFFCRLSVARLFTTTFPMPWIRLSVTFDHERLEGVVGLGSQT